MKEELDKLSPDPTHSRQPDSRKKLTTSLDTYIIVC